MPPIRIFYTSTEPATNTHPNCGGPTTEAPTANCGELDVSAVQTLHCRWAREGQSVCSELSPGKTVHGPRVLSREYDQEGWAALILRADYFTFA